MALDAAIEWNFTNGSSASINNGGGFKRGGTGTDYSYGGSLPANDAPHLAMTDFEVKGGDYDRVYSSTEDANLGADCIGNIIHVTGDGGSSNFTAGWYEVTGNGNDGDNYLDIDRDCATGNANDGIANLGGALAVPDDAFFEQCTAGNIGHWQTGTYTLGGNINVAKDGTAAAPMLHVGYKTAKHDQPSGNDRPLIAAGANNFIFDNYWQFRHFRETTTAAAGLQLDTFASVYNLDIVNSSGTANRRALYFRNNNAIAELCSLKATNGYGADSNSQGTGRWLRCYFYDCATNGLLNLGADSLVEQCIFDSCGIGIALAGNRSELRNNTFYHNTTGISGAATTYGRFLNNIIEYDTGDTGASWSSAQGSNDWDYNNWHGSGTDVSNVTKGANATAHDPDFENAGSDDFRLKTTSSCIAAGLGMAIGTGGNATSVDQGALQTTVSGGGGLLMANKRGNKQ